MTVLDNQNKQNYQNGFLIYNKEFIFKGKFLSSEQFKIAEICFNTSMTGYQEILTDPSYKSQFINFTFPLIGIVGCNDEDYESWKIHASGIVIKELVFESSNWRSTENFIKETLEDGPIDILVNNVGASPSRNFLYMSDQDWQDLHELNLLSAVRCTRSFLPHMREQKWGRVIMISSSAGKYPSAALIDYGATKSAMISISKSLAKKYGRDGVLVNSVLPGLIHTAMWERAAGEIAESSGSSAEEVIKKNGFSVPIGRYGTSEEVAALVVFLCSNAASYINGSAIEVDGGQAGHI